MCHRRSMLSFHTTKMKEFFLLKNNYDFYSIVDTSFTEEGRGIVGMLSGTVSPMIKKLLLLFLEWEDRF